MENRVRELREDNDYTQQYVADKIGITQRKYSYIETGTQQLTAEILVALSTLYNVSVDYLLKQTGHAAALPRAPPPQIKQNPAPSGQTGRGGVQLFNSQLSYSQITVQRST